MLTIWSQEWVDRGWYREWSRLVHTQKGVKAPSHGLTVQGCGHQGLCDLGLTVPHFVNRLLRTSLGLPSDQMASTVNDVVVAFLRNAHVLTGHGKDMRGIAHTAGHMSSCDSG